MSVNKAVGYARKARKLAPPELYDVVRNLELALEELAVEMGHEKSSMGKGPNLNLKAFRGVAE